MVYVREGTFRRHCAMIPAWWPRVCYDDAAQGCETRCTIGQIDAKDEESSSDSRRVQLREEKKKDEKTTEDKKAEKKNDEKQYTDKKKDEKESEEKVEKKKEKKKVDEVPPYPGYFLTTKCRQRLVLGMEFMVCIVFV